jgi:hypothetical protein
MPMELWIVLGLLGLGLGIGLAARLRRARRAATEDTARNIYTLW